MKKKITISLILAIFLTLILGLDNLIELIKYNERGSATLIGFIIGYILLTLIFAAIIFVIMILVSKIINKIKK